MERSSSIGEKISEIGVHPRRSGMKWASLTEKPTQMEYEVNRRLVEGVEATKPCAACGRAWEDGPSPVLSGCRSRAYCSLGCFTETDPKHAEGCNGCHDAAAKMLGYKPSLAQVGALALDTSDTSEESGECTECGKHVGDVAFRECMCKRAWCCSQQCQNAHYAKVHQGLWQALAVYGERKVNNTQKRKNAGKAFWTEPYVQRVGKSRRLRHCLSDVSVTQSRTVVWNARKKTGGVIRRFALLL